jgi:hypothetical protein
VVKTSITTSKRKGFMDSQEEDIITLPLDTLHNKDTHHNKGTLHNKGTHRNKGTLQLEAIHPLDTHPVHLEDILLQAIQLLTIQDILVVDSEV